MPERKMENTELLEFIRKFYKQYNVVPGIGFLAGIYKVTPHTIYRRLDELEEQKKLKRTMSDEAGSKKKKFQSYELL